MSTDTDPDLNVEGDARVWMEDAARRVPRAVQNSALRVTAHAMATSHRYAIDYIEQAPVFILFLTRGRSVKRPGERAMIASQFRQATRGKKLAEALRFVGASMPLRKLRGAAVCNENADIIWAIRNIPPSTLSQAIPDKLGQQVQWLIALRMLYRNTKGMSDGQRVLEWAVKATGAALRTQPSRNGQLRARVRDLHDYWHHHRATFNYNWTFEQAEAAQERWHTELTRRTNEESFVRSTGRAFDEEIDYAPTPNEPRVVDGFTFTPLRSGLALFEEGVAMHHCVASYSRAVFLGVSRIFSLTDADGARVATLELTRAKRTWTIRQLAARFNHPPSKSALDAATKFTKAINSDEDRPDDGGLPPELRIENLMRGVER